MRIRNQYEIHFDLQQPTPIVAMLRLHPSNDPRRVGAEQFFVQSSDIPGNLTQLNVEEYLDDFGNRCSRFVAPIGLLQLRGESIVDASEEPDQQGLGLPLTPVQDLPHEILHYLLPSRYCEVDRFNAIANDLFGNIHPGWALAAAIRDWVHWKVAFNYQQARATKTAMDVYTERVGVCRDYQHLAITLSRALNIPSRYVTGYLGDIRIPFSGAGDFSAWYQVFLDGRWWDMDARHNEPRLGRILMATGFDAADVAITTSFGHAELKKFFVNSIEIDADGKPVPLPPNFLATPLAAQPA